MYAGSGFTTSELGDVDVLFEEGVYHLFHLVLPNHDYIAHAVSEDGFVWRRVRNALFIGNPGEWDDDMLWTMHVTRDPQRPRQWRMLYTGLSRRENGRVQRVGLARSTDLYDWQKDTSGRYPLEIAGSHYESSTSEGRSWVSFRDPFFFREGAEKLLLASGRVKDGPVIRRGCVALARETAPDEFTFMPPLLFPRMYDDVEVPALFRIGKLYYLTGSIREDRKVHYWYAENRLGPYSARYDNVLLPQGNYAARIMSIEGRHLIWNFFVKADENGTHILPPPKELDVGDDGRLLISSFRGFDDKAQGVHEAAALAPMRPILQNPTAASEVLDDAVCVSSESGYEVFHLSRDCVDFRLRGTLIMDGSGKGGFCLRSDHEANGLFISLDMVNGIAQARAWGIKGTGQFEDAFQYSPIQKHHFAPHRQRRYPFELIAYGGYFELSMEGHLVLSFIDTTYPEADRLGFYVEGARLRVCNITLEPLQAPTAEDHGLI